MRASSSCGFKGCWGHPTVLEASHGDGLLPQSSKDSQQGSSDQTVLTAGRMARAEEKEEKLPPSPIFFKGDSSIPCQKHDDVSVRKD